MADEYRQLNVSADQIDSAVNWVEANKDEIEQDFLVVENCFDRIAAAEERLDENEEAVNWVEENKETIEQDFVVLDNCFDRIAAAEVKIANLESAQVEVDSDFSDTSENPVQNKVITEQFSHYYTTTETDEKITEKVSEIVAGAPEDFNTLKEMSDWLTEHEDSAATMNSAIQKNAADIATVNTNITKNAEDIETANENIQANADDITTVKNDVAINRTTLGIQCKNLLPYKCVPNSGTCGIVIDVDDDGIVTLSGTTTVSFTYNINFTTPMKFDRDVFIIGAEKITNANYCCKVDIKVNGSLYPTIGTAGLRIPAGTTISYLYFQQTVTGKEIEATVAPMIVYADVLDRTYEPYTPSLQEQINSLLARIEALETTTTEGGE